MGFIVFRWLEQIEYGTGDKTVHRRGTPSTHTWYFGILLIYATSSIVNDFYIPHILRRICLSETGFGLVSMVLSKPEIISSKPKPVLMILESGQLQEKIDCRPQSNDAAYPMGKIT